MKRRTKIGICLVACAWAFGQDLQPDTQVGDFHFKMPPGWRRVEKLNVTALVPDGLPPGKPAFLTLFPAVEMTSSLREWFDGQ